jgi:hypothetical protein
MLSILSDTQKAVLETTIMKVNLAHALDYLKNMGYPMSRRTYYRHKKNIQELKLDRMRFIAKVAYEEQHLERLDRMEMIENEMWLCYWREKDHSKKVKILDEIPNIQAFISSYYEARKHLVEGRDFKVREQLNHLNPAKALNNVMVDKDRELYWTDEKQVEDDEPSIT